MHTYRRLKSQCNRQLYSHIRYWYWNNQFVSMSSEREKVLGVLHWCTMYFIFFSYSYIVKCSKYFLEIFFGKHYARCSSILFFISFTCPPYLQNTLNMNIYHTSIDIFIALFCSLCCFFYQYQYFYTREVRKKSTLKDKRYCHV